MSARDDVLAAVRAALAPERASEPDTPYAHGEDAGTASEAPTASGDGTAPTIDRAAMLDLFAERVADYQATVTRCAAADLETTVITALDGARSVVVPASLELDVPGAKPDDGLTHAALDAVDAVVTGATVGIAETGTVILDHGAGQGRRAITLLPDLHVCVVREDQVVPDVPDAFPRLDPHRPQTWISGPSATSDIELSRVEGVHGPRHLHVILVADRTIGGSGQPQGLPTTATPRHRSATVGENSSAPTSMSTSTTTEGSS
jgi:L-lactate dehydrogenase complex protein LldG